MHQQSLLSSAPVRRHRAAGFATRSPAKRFKGSGGGDAMAAQEAARQQAITQGTQSVNDTFDKTFTPDFFNKYQTDYTGFYEPQVQDQYNNAKRALTLALADSGNLNSSAGNFQLSQLDKEFGQQENQIQSGALGAVNSLKGNVANSRANLIAALNQSGDATTAANSAAAQASLLTAPQTFQPLGQLFGDITSIAQNQANLERGLAYGSAYGPAVNTGIFGGSPNGGSVVNIR